MTMSAMTTSLFRIDMLPGREGDCLWIEYGDPARPRRILVDGGRRVAYASLKKRFMALRPAGAVFELLVLSHVDADHIEGLLKLIRDPELEVRFKDVWFNGEKHLQKPKQGPEALVPCKERRAEGLRRRRWKWNAAFRGKSVVIPDSGGLPVKVLAGGMRLTLLSPTWDKLQKLAPVWEKELRKAGLVKERLGPTSIRQALKGWTRRRSKDVGTWLRSRRLKVIHSAARWIAGHVPACGV